MATIPQHSGYQVIYGTSTGKNAHLVDTWIEYDIDYQVSDDQRLYRMLTVYFYGALKSGNTTSTSHENSLNTTFSVNGVSGSTVTNGACDYTSPDKVNLYGMAHVNINCGLEGGTVNVPVVGTATTHSEWISGGTIDTTIPVEFSAATYTITYDGNGGSSVEWGTSWSEQVTYGTNYYTRENWYERSGYTFIGWNEQPDGSGSDWTDWIGKPWLWTYTKNVTLYAQWTPSSYTLDINGLLDGVASGNIDGYGTFDVYINGYLMASNVSDYCQPYPYGYTFEITNIQAFPGKTYLGTSSGSLSGTILGNITTQLNFKTNTYYFNMNILTPEGDEPWQTGDAGSVEMSINGGEWQRLYNEPQTSEDSSLNSYYPYGTIFQFKNFISGTGLHLLSVSGATDSDGIWTAVMGDANLDVIFQTAYNNYSLAVQGYIDGNLENGILGYGMFDVYVNGEEYQLDCDDEFTVSLPYGSFYEIKNIRAEKTTVYNGVLAGNLSGTIDEDKIVILQFSTKVITADLNIKVKVNDQAKQGVKGVIRKNNQNKKIIRFYTKVNGVWNSK